MRYFLSWTQKHYRIDATTSTIQRKTGEPTSVDPCPNGRKEFSHKGSKVYFVRPTRKIHGTVRKELRMPLLYPASCSQRHTDHRESNVHTRKTHLVDRGTCIDSVPCKIYNVHKTTRSASSNRDGALAEHVLKDTTITKRQLAFAARMMLEQVSRLSEGDYTQSTMLQLSLDCVDRATEHSSQSVSDPCILKITRH